MGIVDLSSAILTIGFLFKKFIIKLLSEYLQLGDCMHFVVLFPREKQWCFVNRCDKVLAAKVLEHL